MNRKLLLAIFALSFISCSAVSAVTIPTVLVGDSGNGPDRLYGDFFTNPDNRRFGAVAYDYRIGTTEVTVGQYAAFLNAVAASDPLLLYDARMATDPRIAGIAQSGAPGSFSYSVIGSANTPITYVSWLNAARFVNWLHNGQPSGPAGPGTTDTGAYTIAFPFTAITRNPGAQWFLPTEDEWYKAAYYQPAAEGGDVDDYWDFPTATNSTPYSDQPPGSDAPTPSNTGNFIANDLIANGYNDGYAVAGVRDAPAGVKLVSEAGAYSSAASYYGTFDQLGNVSEMTETTFIRNGDVYRVSRGSAFDHVWPLTPDLRYANSNYFGVTYTVGFRVATVPEPSTIILAAVALLGVVALGRRAPV